MTTGFSFVRDITPATSFPWKVKVKVLHKFRTRETVASPQKATTSSAHVPRTQKKYQWLILTDSEGTQVQLTIFGKDVDLFEDTLQEGSWYVVSNCKVSRVEDKNKIVPFPYQWVLGASSLVESCADTEDIIIPFLNVFTPFEELYLYKDNSTKTVDIIAIALHISHPKEIITKSGPSRLQEVVIINDKLHLLTLTLWNEFIDNEGLEISKIILTQPVIVAKRLKVTSYNGVSLSTKYQSSIVIAPDFPEVKELQMWMASNIVGINHLINSQSFRMYMKDVKASVEDEIVSIADLAALPDNRNYLINSVLEVINFEQSFWYMGCDFHDCARVTTAPYMEVYTCNPCRAQRRAIPYCRLQLRATDSTGSIFATIFKEDAEKFLGSTALNVMRIMEKKEKDPPGPLLKFKSAGEIKVFIKPSHQEFGGETMRKFTIAYPTYEDDHGKQSTSSTSHSAKRALFEPDDDSENASKKIKTSPSSYSKGQL